MADEAQAVKNSMVPLFREARAKKLWFFCGYQQIWLSPDELAAQQTAGKLLWGAVNWQLRNPVEALDEYDRKLNDIHEERQRFAVRIRAA